MSSSVKEEEELSKREEAIPGIDPLLFKIIKRTLLIKENYESQEECDTQRLCEYLMDHMLRSQLHDGPRKFKPEVKNAEDSKSYREKGNKYFALGDNMNAMEYYTKSLAYADNQELMAYAYGNRSAALYRQQMFQECLIDVDIALSLGYPEDKRNKLTERRAKTLLKLWATVKMEISSPEEYKLLKNILEEKDDKSNNKEIKLIHPTEDDIYKIVMIKTKSVKTPRYIIDEGQPKLLYGPNKEAPAASEGMKIVYSEKFGRHLIATKGFNPGDVLSIEKTCAYSINFNQCYTRCHHCLRKSYNLIPCHVCPIVVYCSEECRKAAWNSVHNIECPILALLPYNDKKCTKFVLQILRLFIALTKGGKGIKDLHQEMKIAKLNTDKRTLGFTNEGILDSTSARSALGLTTNITGLPSLSIYGFACFCTLPAVLLATETNFYGKQYPMKNLTDSDIFQDIIFSAAILFRAHLIMSSNCFSIQDDMKVKVGGGLFIFHSLYNHSCEANTFRHFDGLTMITRARKPIRPGEQIFVNYGPDCAHFTKEERKDKLINGFHFDCKCPACVENWPSHKEILENCLDSFKPNTTEEQMIEFTVRVTQLRSRLMKNKYDIEAIKSMLRLLNAVMAKPCKKIIYIEMKLIKYYTDM